MTETKGPSMILTASTVFFHYYSRSIHLEAKLKYGFPGLDTDLFKEGDLI